MAERIRALDWARTPLGSIEQWPQSLRTALDMVLAMPSPATILWGPAHVQIYNDSYIAIARDRHPALLGRPVAEGWPDAYDAVIAPLLGRTGAGCAVQLTDFAVRLEGPDGRVEERLFDTDWSPIRDETGAVAGALQLLIEATDRLKAQKAMRESEARHRLLIGSWAQAVWETDPEGVVIADSPSWRLYTGQTLEQWLGYGWLDAIHSDDRAYAEQQWREAIAARGLVNAEFRLRAPDGGWRWTNVRAAPVLDAQGKIEKWAGMNIDIDAHKGAEAVLRESEARLAAAFESVPVGAAVVDMYGAAVLSNARYRRFLPNGILPSRDPVRGARWRGWDHQGQPLERNEFPAARALRGESVVPGQEMLYTDDDNREIWTSVATVPTRDDRGRVTGLVTTISDIDAAKRSAEALRTNEEMLRGFGDASTDVLWIRDAETLNWTYLTPAFEAIYGLPREQALVGNNYCSWLDLIVPEDRDHARSVINRVRDGEHVTFEYRVRRPSDGAIRWLRNTDFPIRNAEGRIVAIGGVGHDATREKEAEETLRESEAQLQVLVAELQHRTRNLIGVVGMIMRQIVATSASLADFRTRFTERLEALSRVQSLFSRRTDEAIGIGDIVRIELDALGAGQAGDRVTVEGEAVVLRKSAVQTLSLAIHELATNARKYGALHGDRGRLAVQWQEYRGEDGKRRLRFEWTETGIDGNRPEAAEPMNRGGYGRKLIEEALPYTLKAKTTYMLGDDRLACTIDMPLER